MTGRIRQIVNRLKKSIPPTVRQSSFSFWPRKTAAGVVVDADNALEIDSVLTCVRVLAESMAALPLNLLERDGDKMVSKADKHPVYELIRWQPNEEMTAYEFRIWLMVDCLIRGNGVAQVQRSNKGVPLALWPLEANQLSLKRAPGNGRLLYVYRTGSKTEALLEANEVLHIRTFMTGGLMGLSLVDKQRAMLGSAKAANDYSSEFFANGHVLTGTLDVPTELSEPAYNRLKEDWNEWHSGTGNRHKSPMLEGGTKFTPIVLNHEESQLLETRKFQRSTIAGLFRVPAHMINDLEKATFSNIEHQDLGFVKHTLRPWMTNWEQRLRLTLLGKEDRETHFFKHNDRDLLRGDLPSRFAAYGTGIQSGFMSPNDARLIEDMNPFRGGDVHLINGAMQRVNDIANGKEDNE